MDRLSSMAVFIEAADRGSFAAAGNALQMSAQMVGKHILFLEERLGTSLLNRTTRRQSLTEAGRVYYQHSKKLLEDAEQADSLIDAMHAEPSGLLRINAPVTFGASRMTALITRYLQQYPKVQVELTLNDRYVDLIEDGYEAVIRLGELDDSSLIARQLQPYQCLICATPGYLAEHGTPQIPQDLQQHECLGFTHWARPNCGGEWEFVHQGRTEQVSVGGRLKISDSKAMLEAALQGFGILLAAEVLVQEALSQGRLVALLPDYSIPARPMHIVFRPDRHLSPKLRSFVDYVVAELGLHPESNSAAAISR
ncbi:LysR family transcriptional regulator [Rahnella sp. SAP-1]|uniref:LysR family transcriptional regulator n=1 Tax=Rouxiella aceris TaxID=2703884 RepID=A0A848MCJ6_9GAMM|nr:LysR substrate-binding domain-containing protein [Rouxiella aceris]NMP25988.1 LysR family transcriptional regulator [Rouxiella aceris]